MAKNVDFKGIVRATSAQNNADGNCEEIINMRQDTGVWQTVGRKKRIMSGVPFSDIYVHKYRTFENYIGVRDDKLVWFDKNTSEVKQELGDTLDKPVYSQLNNILMIRIGGEMLSLTFSANKYSDKSFALPPAPGVNLFKGIPKSVSSSSEIQFLITDPLGSYEPSDVSRTEAEAAKQLVLAEFNKLRSSEPNWTEGYVFYCTTYQLFDGTETRPSAPKVVELGSRSETDFFGQWQGNAEGKKKMIFKFQDLSIGRLSVGINYPSDRDYKETVKYVNFYISNPISHKDVENVDIPSLYYYAKKWFLHNIGSNPYPGTQPASLYGMWSKYPTKEEIKKMLFYRVAQFEFGDERPKEVLFNSLTTNPLMPVDSSGWMGTSGDMFVYNNRLHLYGLRRGFINKNGLVAYTDITNNEKEDVTCNIFVNAEEAIIKVERKMSVCPKIGQFFLSFNDSRATIAEFLRKDGDNTICHMVASDTYNFSFGLQGGYGFAEEVPENFTDGFEEGNNIIVSEQLNPAYFPPEHSYMMPGEVINMAVNTEQISTSQIGQFPLYVFTTEGVYALQVGDGKVLYSNVIPISAEVVLQGSSVLQTRYGIVFITGSGLKLISGQNVVDMSEPVDGKPDMSIRRCPSYEIVTGNDMLCHVDPFLSMVPFREYIAGAVMGYDISRDEIIVSNNRYKYSYVYNLKCKNWHKITETFSSMNRKIGVITSGGEIVTASATATISVDEIVVSEGTQVELRSKAVFDSFNEDRTIDCPHAVMKVGNNVIFEYDFPAEIDTSNLVTIMMIASELKYDNMTSDPSAPYTFKLPGDKYIGQVLTITVTSPETIVFRADILKHNEVVGGAPSMGIGQTISVDLDGEGYEYVLKKGDNVSIVANELYGMLSFYQKSISGNVISLTAEPGREGKAIEFKVYSSKDGILSKSGFTGGGEWREYYSDVFDIEKEDESVMPVLLQTRPLFLDSFGFKSVSHTLLRGELLPFADEGRYFGAYVFGSDDLINWYALSQYQFNNYRPHVVLERCRQSFRYFVLIACGDVQPGHRIAMAEFEGGEKYDNRLR